MKGAAKNETIIIEEEPVLVEQEIFPSEPTVKVDVQKKRKRQKRQVDQDDPERSKPSWTAVVGDMFEKFFTSNDNET
jgi:hypothetical protein